MYMLSPESAIAVAFVNALSKNENKRFLTYKEISELGYKTACLLEQKTGEATLFKFYEDVIDEFLYYNSNYFEECRGIDGFLGVRLKDRVGIENLINKFLGWIPLDILLAYIEASKQVVILS